MTFEQWAQRWQLPPQALDELRTVLSAPTALEPTQASEGSEAGAQQRIALQAPRGGDLLWRNNSGAYKDDHGNFIRYGLCNSSKRVNTETKSSDLIGVTRVGPLGVFTAVEVKRPGWVFKGRPEEKAQLNYLNIVRSHGGIATFATCINDYLNAVREYKNVQTNT